MKKKPRILLILPCNSGAKVGNYFQGHYWKVALKWLKALNLRPYVTLGAIDCIPYKYGLGDCIVLENEMKRVKGHDVYPQYEKNEIEGISKCIEAGLKRILPLFDRIYIILNVKLYQEATEKAIHRLNSGKIIYVKPKTNRPVASP